MENKVLLFDSAQQDKENIENKSKQLTALIDDKDKIDTKKFYALYEEIIDLLSDFWDKYLDDCGLTDEQEDELFDWYDNINNDINMAFDYSSSYINLQVLNKIEDMENRADNNQALQLTVFSIVLTILSFVLTNAKILAADNIDFKNVLLINLTYLLVCSVLFTFILFFINGVHRKLSTIASKLVLAFILIVLLIVSICFVAVKMP